MECGRQCCALHQITRIERRSKYSCSDCFLCIPFVFSEVQTKLAIYMYVTCVCNRTWSLGLRAPLVPCNIFPFPKHRCMIWYDMKRMWLFTRRMWLFTWHIMLTHSSIQMFPTILWHLQCNWVVNMPSRGQKDKKSFSHHCCVPCVPLIPLMCNFQK